MFHRKHSASFEPLTAESRLVPGQAISAEQATQLGDVFERKITDLSRQPKLSYHESSFIDVVADASAQNIDYLVHDKGMKLPIDANTKWLYMHGWALAHEVGIDLHSPDLHDVLGAIAGKDVGMRGRPHLRSRVEDFAQAGVKAFGSLVEANGGHIIMDKPVATSLNDMLAAYEKVENEQTGA